MAEDMEQRRLDGLFFAARFRRRKWRSHWWTSKSSLVGGGEISENGGGTGGFKHGGLLVAAENGERSGGAGGAVVQGAAQRREQLETKKFSMGGFRGSDHQPTAAAWWCWTAGLKTKVPKRKDFGAEGAEGDTAHALAPARVSRFFSRNNFAVWSRKAKRRNIFPKIAVK